LHLKVKTRVSDATATKARNTVGIHDQSRRGQHGTRAGTDQLTEYRPTTF